eukprot:TRINITY_DN114452_c0_g1_i1.p1 TRINITY_DN114452_c0_g1~~TRINITY_DN114452_c0_g1_i1.p1  ORF type:complete len:406 (-),score=53.71 TRINITY_DN114452_c0_g1_i1:313-1365(-)
MHGKGRHKSPVVVWKQPPCRQSAKVEEVVQSLVSPAKRTFERDQNSSFWVGAFEEPSCTLERFALDVFWYHIRRLRCGSLSHIRRMGVKAGAEFWVQRRARSLDRRLRAINWHFDKDEDLRDASDLVVHPLIGTVTYLTAHGAPLVALNAPKMAVGDVDPELEEVEDNETSTAYVVYPRLGRHVAFRGDMLHGCPVELEQSPGERLSVLVNVWLHHQPLGLRRHPPDRATRGVQPKAKKTAKHASKCSLKMQLEEELEETHVHRPSELGTKAARTLALPLVCGPWKLSGLKIPEKLPSDRPWAVKQEPGMPASAARVRARKLLARTAALKRPAAHQSNSQRPAAKGARTR